MRCLLLLLLALPLPAQPWDILELPGTSCGEVPPRLELTSRDPFWMQFSLHQPDRPAWIVLGAGPLALPPFILLPSRCGLYIDPLRVLTVPGLHVTRSPGSIRFRFTPPSPFPHHQFQVQVIAMNPPVVSSAYLVTL